MSDGFEAPKSTRYDVIIVGGAMYGSSVAWFLSDNADFDGSILVVERDPTYEACSTAHTNSCMRQQFSREINVRVSQFAADFVKNLREYMGGDERVPKLSIRSFGYMYLADNPAFAATLQEAQKGQAAAGAGTKFMTRDEIARDYPFYNLDDIIGANHNLIDEGYFDGNTIFDWWKRSARERGAEYVTNEVVSMGMNEHGTAVETVTLKTGETISCGMVVNTSGPRAVRTSRMAGIEIPVEPRKRYTFIFAAEKPLDRDLILDLAADHEALITIEEGAVGGFGSHVLQHLAMSGALDMGLKIRTLTMPDVYVDQASPKKMIELAGLDSTGIVNTGCAAMDMAEVSELRA